MERDFAPSIGDGYPEYVADELGYNYHASEVISASESSRHEAIRYADNADLDDLEQRLEPLSDLERWALARRHLERGAHQAYFTLANPLVDGDLDHPALHYPEIFVDIARRRAETDDLDAARELIDTIAETWPQFDDAIPLLHAQLLLYAEKIDEAKPAYREVLDEHEDIDLFIETAEDFQRCDAPEIARYWLRRAREAAEEADDRASLVDIELLSQSLPDDRPEPVSDDAPGNDNRDVLDENGS